MHADHSLRATPSPVLPGVSTAKIGRAFARFYQYLQDRRTNPLLELSEQQLRDIGADPETLAHVAETRTLNSSRGPGGRIWVQLMNRGPGS